MTYVSRLLLSAFAMTAGAGVINGALDPFGAFASGADDEIQQGALFASNARVAKAHIAARRQPEAIILGSSRAEVGLSPAHRGWQFERVYNLGLPHASIAEILAYYEHAIAAGALKQAVLGLDFFQFNPVLAPRPDFSTCRLNEAGSSRTRWHAMLCDMPVLLFSRRAVIGSRAEVVGLGREKVYLGDGSRNGLSKEYELRRQGSQHAAFLESEYRYFNERDLLAGFHDSPEGFEATSGPHFEALLRLSYEHGIDLRLFISPSHARQWELIREMGLWDEFVHWKRFLLRTAENVAREYGADPYTIWDFADYNPYSQEELPPLDDPDARMRWYWESSHYTLELGGRVLDQVLSGRYAGMGRKLESADFDAWMRTIEDRRAQYADAAKHDLTMMHDYLVTAKRRREILARIELSQN